eukprot:1152533-Pelagomonas_calceolata.AAC.1
MTHLTTDVQGHPVQQAKLACLGFSSSGFKPSLVAGNPFLSPVIVLACWAVAAFRVGRGLVSGQNLSSTR